MNGQGLGPIATEGFLATVDKIQPSAVRWRAQLRQILHGRADHWPRDEIGGV